MAKKPKPRIEVPQAQAAPAEEQLVTYLSADVRPETYNHCQRDVTWLLEHEPEAAAVLQLRILLVAMDHIARQGLLRVLSQHDNLKDTKTIIELFTATAEHHVRLGKATPAALQDLTQQVWLPLLEQLVNNAEQGKQVTNDN